jgi:hypothetical protein
VDEALDRLARRLEADPFFLAWALAQYARSQGLDDSALAARLGCEVPVLTRLRLCRCPAEEPTAFRTGVSRLAERFGANADVLAEAVSLAWALSALRGPAAGKLLAARDAEPPPDEPPGGES